MLFETKTRMEWTLRSNAKRGADAECWPDRLPGPPLTTAGILVINITVATVIAGQVKPIRTTVEQPSLADSSPRIHNHFLTLYCCMYAH